MSEIMKLSRCNCKKRPKRKLRKTRRLKKQNADYDKCLSNANEFVSKALNTITSNLSTEERLQKIQLINNLGESYKKDCDRNFGK